MPHPRWVTLRGDRGAMPSLLHLITRHRRRAQSGRVAGGCSGVSCSSWVQVTGVHLNSRLNNSSETLRAAAPPRAGDAKQSAMNQPLPPAGSGGGGCGQQAATFNM